MDFRLTRLILIDSYCRNETVAFEFDGHVTINGENGSGKTTLLRLLPMFLGESPSRIIRSDAVTEKFGRYYFPSTASYVIYEYQRRGSKVMAAIHADGQSDGVAYRFIDSEYRPELFRSGSALVENSALYRHLDKLGVYASKTLTRQEYRNVIQNTGSREQRELVSRFAFTGGTGKLTHIERIVTGILQRVTTFADLKRMIVSSLPDSNGAFSLRTGKKDLLQWIKEYEAHHAVMEKQSVMADLEQADHGRRLAEAEFARLHARFRLLHDHFQELEQMAEKAEKRAKEELDSTEKEYREKLQAIHDDKAAATAEVKAARSTLDQLEARRKYYADDDIDAKSAKVDRLPGQEAKRQPLLQQLADLQGQFKSISEVFEGMERDANAHAQQEKMRLAAERTAAWAAESTQIEKLTTQHKAALAALRLRHETELAQLRDRHSQLKADSARLRERVANAQADQALLAALETAREAERAAAGTLAELHDKSAELQRAASTLRAAFTELETRIDRANVAIEHDQDALEKLLAAESAGEDTLLGFLRKNKPDWEANIGKLVSEEMLLRRDLAPSIGDGDDLYGVCVDLEKLHAGRFANEEELQREIKLVRARLERRNKEVGEERSALADKGRELAAANAQIDLHSAAIATARQAKTAADARVQAADARVAENRRQAKEAAARELKECEERCRAADELLRETANAQQQELAQAETRNGSALASVKQARADRLAAISLSDQQVDADLARKIADIRRERDESLHSKGVDTSVIRRIEQDIEKLDAAIAEGNSFVGIVTQYRHWLEDTWSQRPAREQELQDAIAKEKHHAARHEALRKERDDALKQKEAAIKAARTDYDKYFASRSTAGSQLQALAQWPLDLDTLHAGHDPATDMTALIAQRHRTKDQLREAGERIRLGVDDIRRQMCASIGTGPERFYSSRVAAVGHPGVGREHEWIGIFRDWFANEHATNRSLLLQMGKNMAQGISAFWKDLGDFKRNVSVFAADLKANLEQGKLFDSIADVTTHISTHVDTQNYWAAIETLHHEYDAWYTLGESTLPPPSFVAAARDVALVLNDEKGLVADPLDLISLKISANVNGQGAKTASNEKELEHMSSNGLSYIILCVVLIGFVNRIRRKERVVIPFVVDELKDLSFNNASTLLELFTRNDISMISAFPDVDLDLAELFTRNYKILPGRRVGQLDLSEDDGEPIEHEEVAHV